MASKTLFIILGNQLFPINELNKHKDSYFFMAEDYELCTYEKHHKHKIILFLSSMRKYASELKNKKFNIKYWELNKKNIKFSYEDKLNDFIKNKLKSYTHISYKFEIFFKIIFFVIKKNTPNTS